jgi:hypothetical protein
MKMAMRALTNATERYLRRNLNEERILSFAWTNDPTSEERKHFENGWPFSGLLFALEG